MRIRTKLNIIEALLLVGSATALVVMFFFSSTTIALKDFEIMSQKVLLSLEQISMRTESMLTSTSRITVQKAELEHSIARFEQNLKAFSEAPGSRFLGEEEAKALIDAVGWWDQINNWYYGPAFEHIEKMSDSGMGRRVGDRGLFQTYLESVGNDSKGDPFIAHYQTLKNYQLLILDNIITFRSRMNDLIDKTRLRTDEIIAGSRRLAIAIVSLSLLLTIFLTTRFAGRMASRIRKVGRAMELMSRGDFSDELAIQSGDEFQELSEHYNMLKNQLRDKLDSVLDFMFKIGSIQAEGPDPKKVLQTVINSAMENTEADAGGLFLVDEETQTIFASDLIGLLPPLTSFPEKLSRKKEAVDQYIRNHPIKLGETIIGEAITENQAKFVRDSSSAWDRLSQNDPLHIESLIVAPLALPGRIIGAVVVAKSNSGSRFSDLDFTHMRTFADYAALTIDSIYNYSELIERREIRREIEIAAGIQKGLLPRQIPEIKGASLSAYSKAAKGVSGDYYDLFHIGEGNIAVVICDVVGKGVPAAMLMVMIRTILRLSASPERKPAQIITFINKGITGRIGVDHFATMGMFFYHRKEKRISYSNAAHLPLLIFRERLGDFIELDTPGLPIGVESGERYTQRQFQCEDGDVLLFYTDGVTETRSNDGREYGMESLKSIVRSSKGLNADKIELNIREDLERFAAGAEQHDDQTFVVLRINENGRSSG